MTANLNFPRINLYMIGVLLAFSFHGAIAQTQVGADIFGVDELNTSGYSVSMPDTLTVAIGAITNSSNVQRSGQVRVFTYDGNSWNQKGTDLLGDSLEDRYGWAVCMPDANTLAIGAPKADGDGMDKGQVEIFKWDGTDWIQKGQTLYGNSSLHELGFAISMPDSNTISMGAPGYDGDYTNSGVVYVYYWDDAMSQWSLKGMPIEGEAQADASGIAVSMPDANTVAIGSNANDGAGTNAGHVRVFSWTGNSWTQKGADIDPLPGVLFFGDALDMPSNTVIGIGAPRDPDIDNLAGSAQVYEYINGSWTVKGNKLTGDASQNYFGDAIAMPSEDMIAVGAWGNFHKRGVVRIFRWNGTVWEQKGLDIIGDNPQDNFGRAISMPDTSYIAIGAPKRDVGSTDVGQTRIFNLNNTIPFGGTVLANGCISCDSLNVGDLFKIDINGVIDTFTVVDRAMLDSMVTNGGEFEKVCVSKVADMSELFKSQTDFNEDITKWDVSNVTNMEAMFHTCIGFNQDIGHWEVDSVTNMSEMFINNFAFNQNLGSWNVSSVTNMNSMFNSAIQFNQDIGSWDVSNVTTMVEMFALNGVFNKNIGSWDVSKVTNMKGLFRSATSFNQDITNWDVSSVSNMSEMFKNNYVFNQNISSWEVSNVLNMDTMFYGVSGFDQDLSGWCVGKILSEPTDFATNGSLTSAQKPVWGDCNPNGASFDANGCLICDNYAVGDVFYIDGVEHNVVDPSMIDSILNAGGSVGNICASQMTNVSGMFRNNPTFNEDIGSWDMSNVTNSEGMFENALSFNQDISNWDMSSVTITRAMFSGAQSFNQDIGDWDVSGVTNMRAMFNGAHSFNQDLSDWDVSNCTNMSFMFANTFNFNQNINSWDVSGVEYMQMMFTQARAFNQPLNNWNVANVTTMRGMFLLAQSFSQDLSSWCVGNNMNRKPKNFDKASIFGGATLLTPAQSPAWGVPCSGPSID